MLGQPPPNQSADPHVQAARYTLLSEIVVLLAQTEELQPLLTRAINKIKWVIDFGRCTLALVNDHNKTFHLSTLMEANRKIEKVDIPDVPLDKGIPGEVMRIERPYLITDVSKMRDKFGKLPDDAMEDPNLTAILSLPLKAYGQILGALTFSTRNPKGFSDEDIKAATSVATHIALAITHNNQKKRLATQNQLLELRVEERTRELADARDEAERTGTRLATIINNLADGLLVLDADGVIMISNPALNNMFGLGDQSLMGKKRDIFPLADMQHFLENILADPDETQISEVELADKHIGQAVATPIRNHDEISGCVILIRDVTHEKEVDHMKTDFISTVSHELRTPLTSILGFTKIIQQRFDQVIQPQLTEHDDRKVKRAVKQIQQNVGIIIHEGDRLTSLINDVLDIAKMESGKVEWHMESIDVGDVVTHAIDATRTLFDDKPNVTLKTNIANKLPQIHGDKNRLIQVVVNLLSNASKFTDEGMINCELKAYENFILFSVMDTGVGIPRENLKNIFDRFTQVGDTLTDKPTGTGLGLPISKQIVDHHQGRIWAESDTGIGTTVHVALPILNQSDTPFNATQQFRALMQKINS